MSKKILICDDEEGVRESLKLILGDFYDLAVVDGGQQALHTLTHAKDIGLVFLDIKMPKINGIDVLTEIKAKYPKIKIIMVTAIGEQVNEITSPLYGVDAHIDKPFEFERLERVIGQLVGPA